MNIQNECDFSTSGQNAQTRTEYGGAEVGGPHQVGAILGNALDHLEDDIDAPVAAERTATEPLRQDQHVVSLVRVPSAALGMVFDGGRDGAQAAKLLAIKASKGPGFVLNEHYCRRKYGVSRRSFQAGIGHAKKRGALKRNLHGRRFATEKPLDNGSRSFVLIEETLLTVSPSLLAFILAVNLSPVPLRPMDVARRTGVKSAVTIRRLTKEAVDAGAIAKSAGNRGIVLVARKGFNFDLDKNCLVKNGPVKNDPTHKGMEGSAQHKQENTQITANYLREGTHSRARTGFENSFQDEVDASIDPDWTILTPWQNSRGLAQRALYATKGPEAFMSFSDWKWWLNAFGADIPGHLENPAAHRQALEIANELACHPSGNFSEHDAISALAFWVAKACAEGRKIRSLGFIAERILNQLDNGDLSAIYDRPTHMGEFAFGGAYELAIELMAALESHDFPANRARLLSTAAIESLVSLLSEHGRDAIVRGFNHCMEIKRTPGDGYVVCGWVWFEDDITASRHRKRRRAA